MDRPVIPLRKGTSLNSLSPSHRPQPSLPYSRSFVSAPTSRPPAKCGVVPLEMKHLSLEVSTTLTIRDHDLKSDGVVSFSCKRRGELGGVRQGWTPLREEASPRYLFNQPVHSSSNSEVQHQPTSSTHTQQFAEVVPERMSTQNNIPDAGTSRTSRSSVSQPQGFQQFAEVEPERMRTQNNIPDAGTSRRSVLERNGFSEVEAEPDNRRHTCCHCGNFVEEVSREALQRSCDDVLYITVLVATPERRRILKIGLRGDLATIPAHHIKQAVSDYVNVPISKQRLLKEGLVIGDNCIGADFGLIAGCTLLMEVQEHSPVNMDKHSFGLLTADEQQPYLEKLKRTIASEIELLRWVEEGRPPHSPDLSPVGLCDQLYSRVKPQSSHHFSNYESRYCR